MAKDKNSFLLYVDLIHTVKKLSNEQAGELFKHILSYVNDENPVTDNVIIDLVFEPIKQGLKRDLKKYEGIVENRKLAGLASAESRKRSQQVLTSVDKSEQVSTNLTDSDNDSDIKEEVVVEENIFIPSVKKEDLTPYEEIVSLYATTCKSYPALKVISPERKSKIKIRFTEMKDIETVKMIFEKMENSKYMQGDNARGWKATFDWVFENSKNWVKIIEGNYDNRKTETGKIKNIPVVSVPAVRNYDEQF